ncbi:hypothetical protein FHX15_005639 [Rhizobium sp. BK650]|uniref:hypothetical protein n=1 Tax=Rhizobium sp. BK650 TaxID=2586990 RepID=UPI001619AAA1|nr:hypothetical protein [Rhizobium sp. BK650]MBB3660370.1 hypothetical protein [Rhizobium sp. BK650]
MFKFFSIKPSTEDLGADTGTYADGMTDRYHHDLTSWAERRFRSAHERDYGASRKIPEHALDSAVGN